MNDLAQTWVQRGSTWLNSPHSFIGFKDVIAGCDVTQAHHSKLVQREWLIRRAAVEQGLQGILPVK